MDQPLVSIIIPVYKVEKYLRRCLDSVKNQTYKNIEVILVDDGSPDKCPQICDEYAAKDSRFHVIHKENGGVSSARNVGLEYCANNAGGGYIAFVDSDDVVFPETVEECVNNLHSSQADALVFGYKQFAEINDKIVSERIVFPDETYNCEDFGKILKGPIQHMFGIPSKALGNFSQQDIGQYKMFSGVWSWFYRKSFLEKHNLRFEKDLFLYEDGLFLCKVLMNADKIKAADIVGYEYYWRKTGLTASFSYSEKVVNNKLLLVKYRSEIRDFVLRRSGVDISDWAYGSYVLSIFQLCVALANEKHGYRQLKRYISLDEVKRAVKAVPLKGKPKLVLPLFLCKCGCYRLVYIMISLLKKMGISIGL